MKIEDLKGLHKRHKETSLYGRYIHTEHIDPLLKKMSSRFNVDCIGKSVNNENIYSVTIGSGAKKILMWSQMHGNESTTTKALFDLFKFFDSKDASARKILENCTLKIIPILNPDGAKAYTRLNANKTDLNRDAKKLSQPESIVLRSCFNSFKPNYCFNLHGQRTIFSAGNTNNTATLSFLSPAQNKDCTVTENRKIAMSIITSINDMLQREIPNQVGIYDDAFNINCVGDTFQTLNVPTILFEAGHYKEDYNREEVRRFIFQSYIVSLLCIANQTIDVDDFGAYSKIPQNEKLFFDIIIKNAKINNEITDIAIQYEEQLVEETIYFAPKIMKIEKLDNFYAHKYINANNSSVLAIGNESLTVGYENDCVMINNTKTSLKLLK